MEKKDLYDCFCLVQRKKGSSPVPFGQTFLLKNKDLVILKVRLSSKDLCHQDPLPYILEFT